MEQKELTQALITSYLRWKLENKKIEVLQLIDLPNRLEVSYHDGKKITVEFVYKIDLIAYTFYKTS